MDDRSSFRLKLVGQPRYGDCMEGGDSCGIHRALLAHWRVRGERRLTIARASAMAAAAIGPEFGESRALGHNATFAIPTIGASGVG